MRKLLAPMICVSLLSGCVVHVGDRDNRPTEKFSKQLTLPLSSIEQLAIESGSGELKVTGVPGLKQIEVDANIWAYSHDEDEYTLVLEQSGDEAQLIAKQRSRRGFNINFNRSTRIDLTVRVPQSLMIDIDDGSGDIVLSNVQGKVKIDDGSGDIELARLGGDLKIEDNSGSIHITDVEGDVDIDDNSGEILVRNIGGKVNISDGSGDIEIFDVTNNVRIDDGSGDIEVTRVNSLKIIESGSGDVSINDVGSYSK